MGWTPENCWIISTDSFIHRVWQWSIEPALQDPRISASTICSAIMRGTHTLRMNLNSSMQRSLCSWFYADVIREWFMWPTLVQSNRAIPPWDPANFANHRIMATIAKSNQPISEHQLNWMIQVHNKDYCICYEMIFCVYCICPNSSTLHNRSLPFEQHQNLHKNVQQMAYFLIFIVSCDIINHVSIHTYNYFVLHVSGEPM